MQDLAKRVGEKDYPWPQDFSEEAIEIGTSTRVSTASLPVLDGPGKHRLVFIHPKVIVQVTAPNMTMHDLAMELWCEYAKGCVSLQESEIRTFAERATFSLDDFDPVALGLMTEEGQNKLALVALLREADRAGNIKAIEEKYGVTYHEHFFGYTYLERLEWIVPEGTEELPKDLQGRGIVPVRDIYMEDNIETA